MSGNTTQRMNTSAHTLISATVATALALFTFASAALVGLASTATITGISLFVAFGLIEIMIQSYAPPVGVLSRARARREQVAAADVVVAFPSATAQREAA